MTLKAPASPWGCRSLLLTRQTYHVVERDHTCCYCGSITVRVCEPRVGWPLSGLLVQQ